MKRTQNEKILQIKNETLVVGIDIGKETHYARAFDYRGIELANLLRFSNSAQDYEALNNWIQNIMQQKEKTETIMGFDDNSPTKNDRKDPKTIAMVVKDGRFRDVYIPEDLFQELREAVLERERLQEQLNALSNQIIRWLDIRFPEFNNVFKDWSGKTAWASLRAFPTPTGVISAGAEGILGVWRQHLKKQNDLSRQH